MDKEFSIKIDGKFGENVLPSDLTAPQGSVQKAWANFVRELDTAGAKITTAEIVNSGKGTHLPATVAELAR